MDGNTASVSNESKLADFKNTASILYGVQALLAFILNFLVVVLFTCRSNLLSIPHNRCILSLAVTDILTSISVVLSVVLGDHAVYIGKHRSYLVRDFYCRIIWSNYLAFALGGASVNTSVVLSFERWLAVRRSIFYKTRFKIRHMSMLILIAWIAGFAAEAPVHLFVQGVYDDPTKAYRYTVEQKRVLAISLSTLQFVLQTIIPLTLIILAYIDVFRGINRSLQFATSARAENVSGIKRLIKVTKVAATTTFVIAVCWFPSSFWFFISLLPFEPITDYHSPLVMLSGIIVFSNGCINPFIYVFSNPELRKALKSIFR